jgi:hypothetical protein
MQINVTKNFDISSSHLKMVILILFLQNQEVTPENIILTIKHNLMLYGKNGNVLSWKANNRTLGTWFEELEWGSSEEKFKKLQEHWTKNMYLMYEDKIY